MYNRKISSALCSLTDLYLTDLWLDPPHSCPLNSQRRPENLMCSLGSYEEDAEQRCCSYLDEALTFDATNPEVYQSYASVRISQEQPDEARIMMEKSLDVWFEQGEPNNLAKRNKRSLTSSFCFFLHRTGEKSEITQRRG